MRFTDRTIAAARGELDALRERKHGEWLRRVVYEAMGECREASAEDAAAFVLAAILMRAAGGDEEWARALLEDVRTLPELRLDEPVPYTLTDEGLAALAAAELDG